MNWKIGLSSSTILLTARPTPASCLQSWLICTSVPVMLFSASRSTPTTRTAPTVARTSPTGRSASSARTTTIRTLPSGTSSITFMRCCIIPSTASATPPTSSASCRGFRSSEEPQIPRLRPKRAPLGMTIQEGMRAPPLGMTIAWVELAFRPASGPRHRTLPLCRRPARSPPGRSATKKPQILRLGLSPRSG